MTPLPVSAPRFLDLAGGETPRRIARLEIPGGRPTILWLGGLRSDMRGTKAERLAGFAAARGLGYVRFDYSGHGESSGRFDDGTISQWSEDAAAVLDGLPAGPVVLVGSSMGAWIALLLARRARPRHPLRGMLLLAPAPDFTGRLVLPKLSEADREHLDRHGFVAEPSEYSDEPTLYTRQLLEDGARNAVMDGPIRTGCPVHIIQGLEDRDVPAAHALDLVSQLSGEAVTLTMVPDGDHRLSREEDLGRIERALAGLLEEAGSQGSLQDS